MSSESIIEKQHRTTNIEESNAIRDKITVKELNWTRKFVRRVGKQLNPRGRLVLWGPTLYLEAPLEWDRCSGIVKLLLSSIYIRPRKFSIPASAFVARVSLQVRRIIIYSIFSVHYFFFYVYIHIIKEDNKTYYFYITLIIRWGGLPEVSSNDQAREISLECRFTWNYFANPPFFCTTLVC